MANRRTVAKPRSPATDKVFEEFIIALRADPLIGQSVAQRLQAALSPGQAITGPKIEESLFPAEQSVDK